MSRAQAQDEKQAAEERELLDKVALVMLPAIFRLTIHDPDLDEKGYRLMIAEEAYNYAAGFIRARRATHKFLDEARDSRKVKP